MTVAVASTLKAPAVARRWAQFAFGLRALAVGTALHVTGTLSNEIVGQVLLARLRAAPLRLDAPGHVSVAVGLVIQAGTVVTLLGAACITRVPRASQSADFARATFLASVVATGLEVARVKILDVPGHASRAVMAQVSAASAVITLVGGLFAAAAIVFLVATVVRSVRAVGGTPPRWATPLPVIYIAWRVVGFGLPAVASIVMVTRAVTAWTLVALQCGAEIALGTALVVLLWRSATSVHRATR